MTLSDLKNALKTVPIVCFILPNKQAVAPHFHVTEVGLIIKKIIDCGGTVREENLISFQLWSANDLMHRLEPQKLLSIIEEAEKTLQIDNLKIEIEYQTETIGKYNLGFDGENFILKNTQTACLAEDQCGIAPTQTETKPKNSCTPGGSCC